MTGETLRARLEAIRDRHRAVNIHPDAARGVRVMACFTCGHMTIPPCPDYSDAVAALAETERLATLMASIHADAWAAEAMEIIGSVSSRPAEAPVVLTRPPDSFWRDIPCGHPQDPVAWMAPDGSATCHCGQVLDQRSGIALEGVDAGVIVYCSSGCGCHVLVPRPAEATPLPDASEETP